MTPAFQTLDPEACKIYAEVKKSEEKVIILLGGRSNETAVFVL